MTGAPFLVWGHVLLVWAIANYFFRDPLSDDEAAKSRAWRGKVFVRAALAATLIAYLTPNLGLALVVLAGSISLPLARVSIAQRFYMELEIVANAVITIVSFAMVKGDNRGLDHAWIALPANENRISAICLIAALFVFTVHGGTYVVRGLLKKSGTMPMTETSPKEVDMVELSVVSETIAAPL